MQNQMIKKKILYIQFQVLEKDNLKKFLDSKKYSKKYMVTKVLIKEWNLSKSKII